MTSLDRQMLRAGARWLVLAALAFVLMDVACNKQPHRADVYFDPSQVPVNLGTWVEVDVVADVTDGSLQSFDLAFRSNPSTALWIAEARLSDFDDDGRFFLTPVSNFSAGTLDRVVDLRHGESPVTGSVRMVRLRIVPLESGTATVTISKAGLSGAGGQPFDVTLDTLDIDVSP